MSAQNSHRNPLKREGTNQSQRALKALQPENVKLHDLTTENWMSFAKDLGGLFNFFGSEDATKPRGDWDDFFIDKDKIQEFLDSSLEGDQSPHLSLFVAFLRLLEFPQQSLNEIPKRHLDFYFKEVLKLGQRDFTPDKVHLIFELAKNANSELVEKGSLLAAGKDEEGQARSYSMSEDIVVNTGRVEFLRSAAIDEDGALRYAIKTDSLDGLDEALEDGETWSAFGLDNWPSEFQDEAQWPKWNPEFVISSSVLELSEGKREVRLNFDFDSEIKVIGDVQASFTTEKGWSDPLAVEFTKDDDWLIEIPADFDPIAKYDEGLHLLNLDTTDPCLRIRFSREEMYSILQNLTVRELEIDVRAEGLKNLEVRNELGLQAIDKPFMPFGSRPKKNSPCNIYVPELEGKSILSLELFFDWLDLPENLDNHYAAYSDLIPKELNGVLGATIESEYLDGATDIPLFSDPNTSILIEKTDSTARKGELSLRLLESFFHDLYTKIYVEVVTAEGPVVATAIPNEPYTPLLDSLSLKYRALAQRDFDKVQVEDSELDLHILSPFGNSMSETPSGLQERVATKQFYIGLDGLGPKDIINLLFQVAEGSENPQHSTFSEDEGVQWSVLDDSDHWINLEENEILLNKTNNFLSSGIIRFKLPDLTGLDHRLLDNGIVWLKAELAKEADSVSRFVAVHAQAGTAEFQDQKNSHEHIGGGLPAETISQLTRRKSKIKSVTQFYPSHDGKAKETEDAFYQRISERLRHKGRANSIWDYERIVLQEFPEIFKAKCLNHTSFRKNLVDEASPGSVSLVVIPKTTDLDSSFRLKPLVSQSKLDEIKNLLGQKNGCHVELDVINPIYEEVQFSFKVKFLEEYDYNFYREVVQTDLSHFLAPWVADENVELEFDHWLYVYDAINFLENLDYVDFVEDFSMSHKPHGGSWEVKSSITPSNSLSVIVPAENHLVEEVQSC